MLTKPSCHLVAEHTNRCQAYIVRDNMKRKWNYNHTISTQPKIKIECKSILHFCIIKNVAVKRNLIKIPHQTSKIVPGWFSRSQGWGMHSSIPWSKFEFRALLLSLKSNSLCLFSLLWLIPAALWVSAAKQEAHKTQEEEIWLPQKPN